MMAWSVPLA
uniref:Uncharacterized protein n=1 Tax=Arundo donax TaxID=35708 RepID=A0A0A9A4N3_ARUDO